MRQPTHLVAPVLAALVLILVPILPVQAEETRELKSIGAKWTVPDGWTLSDPSEQQKAINYHAVGTNNSIPAQMYVVSETLRDRELKDIADDVINVMRHGLFKKVTAIKKAKGSLSGNDGFLLLSQGKIDGDRDAYAAAYGIAQKGRFYVLLTIVYYGKHKDEDVWKAVDAAKRGFRLLEGGGEDEPASGPWPELTGGSGGAADADDPAAVGGAGGAFAWPENGPSHENGVVTWPSQNLRLTLPEETPFKVVRVGEDETARPQNAIILRGEIGKATAVVQLLIEPRQGGAAPDQIIAETAFQSSVARTLKERQPGGARIDKEVEVAGMDAAFILLRGKNEAGDYAAVGHWLAAHGETMYSIRLNMNGHRGCEKAVIPAVEGLMKGLELITEAEPVPGPLAGGIVSSYQDRGKFQGKEALLRAPNVELQKPAFMSRLSPAKGIAFALEGRTEDRSAYIYMDVGSHEMKVLRQQKTSFESIANDRVAAWKSAAGDGSSVGKSAEPWFKAKWAKAKGIGWRFEGDLDGHPYVELGYIVKHKSRAYVIRIQIGGEGAEQKMKKTLKELQKKWDWVK